VTLERIEVTGVSISGSDGGELLAEEEKDPAETEKKKPEPVLPGQLPSIVFHPRESLVYNTLLLQPIPPLDKSAKSSLIMDLNRYLEMCAQRGLLMEASYICNIVQTVRTVCPPPNVARKIKKMEEDIHHTELEMKAQKEYWDGQEEAYNREYAMNLGVCDIELEERQNDMDSLWASPEKQRKYRKPSCRALDLRYRTQRLISGKRYEDLPLATKVLNERMLEEGVEAAKRMESDYKLSDANLKEEFKVIKSAKEMKHEERMNNIRLGRERGLKPYEQRYELMKSVTEKLKKQNMAQRPATALKRPQPLNYGRSVNEVMGDTPKLELPRIEAIRRQRRSKTDLSATQKGFGKRDKNE
jgi:hypothetical protein